MNIKYYMKQNLKMLLNHVIVQTMSVIITLFAFSVLFAFDKGKILLSVVLSCFYAVYMYSKAYKVGERTTKSYSENKSHWYNGLILYILLFVVTAIIAGINTALPDAKVISMIFTFWNFNIDVIDASISTSLYLIFIFLIPMFSLFLGYIAGMKRFELMYKITKAVVYKKEK